MKNFLKNIDVDQIKDQVADLRDQMQEIKFRKPWTRGEGSSPMLFMAIGAGLAMAGLALYKNRNEVANFCSNCGADLKDKWEGSGIREGLKDKAEKIMSKVKDRGQESAQAMKGASNPANQERFYPT